MVRPTERGWRRVALRLTATAVLLAGISVVQQVCAQTVTESVKVSITIDQEGNLVTVEGPGVQELKSLNETISALSKEDVYNLSSISLFMTKGSHRGWIVWRNKIYVIPLPPPHPPR